MLKINVKVTLNRYLKWAKIEKVALFAVLCKYKFSASVSE